MQPNIPKEEDPDTCDKETKQESLGYDYESQTESDEENDIPWSALEEDIDENDNDDDDLQTTRNTIRYSFIIFGVKVYVYISKTH